MTLREWHNCTDVSAAGKKLKTAYRLHGKIYCLVFMRRKNIIGLLSFRFWAEWRIRFRFSNDEFYRFFYASSNKIWELAPKFLPVISRWNVKKFAFIIVNKIRFLLKVLQ